MTLTHLKVGRPERRLTQVNAAGGEDGQLVGWSSGAPSAARTQRGSETMTADVRRRLKASVVAALAASIAGLSTPSTSAAQDTTAAAPPAASAPAPTAGSLTVVAPRLLRGGSGPVWASGARIGVVSLSRNASFADLDLTTQAGADEFKKRIMYAALDACNDLEAKYPSTVYLPVQVNESCPDTTAASALIIADQIIAAARSHPK